MAGLLDSLFDPSTYGGQGGLLSRLAPMIGALPQSQGFPDAGPQQASPLAIGGYQMPRVGNPDLYQPQQVSLPPNAQPTQGQIPQATPAQPQQLPPALGGNQLGGNFGASLQNFVSMPGGLLPKILGGVTGLTTGQRTDPIGIQQQNLKAQFDATRQALIDNGLDPRQAASTAMLSVLNPEAAKTILPELLTNKEKYQVISEDPLEGKKYGFVNERNQTVNGRELGAATPSTTQGSLATLQQAQQAGVTGDALYEYLPPAYRNTVKAMIEGRQPLPSTTAMRSPATLALIDAAHAIDSTFDATTWKARNDAGPDWTKGKSSEMVRAANQTLAHVGSLMDAMDAMHNTRFPLANYAKNTFNEVTGGGEPGSFRTNAHAVAEEMSKVFKGTNLSDSEIRHWEQNLSENMSPEQQRAQIAKLSELLHGSLQALEEKRQTAMGPVMAAKQGPLIKEEGQREMDRIDSWLHRNPAGSGSTGVQEGATATNPQTGQKIVFKNGAWQPQ